jgi:hypothetical protein
VLHYVRSWPIADISERTAHVRFWGWSGHSGLRKSAFAVAIGGKQTCLAAPHVSAFDSKRILEMYRSDRAQSLHCAMPKEGPCKYGAWLARSATQSFVGIVCWTVDAKF